MTTLRHLQEKQGAVFGAGLVAEHFGDQTAEYHAAHDAAVLIDRSDEGRIELGGADRLAIINRMSTNKVDVLANGEGRATVFTTPIGRIIDRVILHQLADERTLLRTSAGRSAQIANYLRSNIFFRDKMTVADVSADLTQFHLYGPGASEVVEQLIPSVSVLALHHVVQTEFESSPLLAVGLDALGVPGIGLVMPVELSAALWRVLVEFGARPAGRVTSEILRIEAGLPGPEGELNEAFIPLETGLWADVSFNKGCYTGQEIIARMESRGRLAKTLVGVELSGEAAPGTSWSADDREQGTLTSVVQRPDGRWIGLGFARPDAAHTDRELALDNGEMARITLVTGQKTAHN